jgi:phosphatidate cytidylyltransferase
MITRIISAVIAAALVILVTYFFQTTGLFVICSLVVFGCIYEYSKLTFGNADAPKHLRFGFMFLAAMIYVISLINMELSAGVASIAAIIFLTMGVLSVRKTPDLTRALKLQSAGLVGFFYVGIFAATAIGTLNFGDGAVWLFGLLGIVFAGDTFAYLCGRFFGKRKLLEAVSPKKTIEGSIGGLIGSAIAGGVLAYFFVPEIPVYQLALTGFVSGAFGQVGDLFESLLKRIADVKDSGAIMPGHGGFLDRVDGVLFAAPVYYVLVRFLVA